MNMKKILAFTLAFATILSVSCKKETPSTPETPETPETPTIAKLLYNGIELQESMPLMIEVGEVATLVYEGPEGEDVTYPTSQDVLEIDLEALTFKGLKEGECKITLQEKNYTIKVNPELTLTVDKASALGGSKVKLACSWAGLEWTFTEPEDAFVLGKAEFMNISTDKKTAEFALPVYQDVSDLRNPKAADEKITVTVVAPYGKSKSVEITSQGWKVNISNKSKSNWDGESVSVDDVIIIYLTDANNYTLKASVFQSLLQIFYTGSAYTYTTLPDPFASLTDTMLALKVQAGESDYSISIKSFETKQVFVKKACKLTSEN